MPRPNHPDQPSAKSEDPEPNRDVNALFSGFRLDQSSYRTFGRHRSPKPPEQAETVVADSSRPEHVRIGIFSPMGGAGKSTLAASLGSILWQHGKRVLLVDAAPWPTLAFHYGATTTRPGMRSFFAPGGKELPVRILARDPNDPAIPEMDDHLRTDPADYILFDLSGVSGQELATCLQECQVLLIPLVPDPSAVRYAEAVTALLGTFKNPPDRVLYVVNQMDESPLAKTVYASLNQLLGDQLFKKPIYRQAEIQESLSEGIVLPFFARKSQAAAVCSEIAHWLEIPRPITPSSAHQRWSEQ
ncbi:cellulose synthase operon protein YhjQ/BcsQ [Edaphobacter modestus]|uniref:Chromosome partitioning protein n=1 Tax=Edaphobacter modestus TaxID=388466 RepID=A0A4Q7YPG7_9BACT|nr:cellulose synthase operon protein YhjQ/BcsQ [Edaphobacter modestus]RZU38954.1 chromosome partitioning protein [Edaphobacter modestus]